MSPKRSLSQVSLGAGLCLCLSACGGHRAGPPKLDVPGTISAIEQKLLQVSDAVTKGQPEEASRTYDEAKEVFEKNRGELRGDPKFGALRDKMDAAPAELCMGFVSRAVKDFQAAMAKKDAEDSKAKLEKMNQEHARCEKQILVKVGYSALKQTIDAGPQALADLEKALEEEAKLKRMNAEIEDYQNRLSALIKDVNNPDNQAEPGWLADEIQKRASDIKGAVEERIEWKDKPEWAALIKKTHEDLSQVEQKRQQLVVQGKAAAAIEAALRADKDGDSALTQEDLKEKETQLKTALEAFKTCQATLGALVRSNPRLSSYERAFDENKRAVSWVSSHCAQRGQEMKKAIYENKKAIWLAKRGGGKTKLAKAKRKPAPKPRKRK